MKYCSNCGCRDNDDDDEFCLKCGKGLNSSPSSPHPTTVLQSTIAHGFLLSKGESIVKRYNCVKSNRLLSPMEGHLTITNKRIIFTSSGQSSKMISELGLTTYSGMKAYYGRGNNILRMVVGGILGLTGISTLASAFGGSGRSPFGQSFSGIIILIGIALIAGSALIIRNSMQQTAMLAIYSSAGNSTPISIGDMTNGFGLTGQGAAIAANFARAEEMEKMMEELGAIISDMQTTGL